jgi:hypothetical protein
MVELEATSSSDMLVPPARSHGIITRKNAKILILTVTSHTNLLGLFCRYLEIGNNWIHFVLSTACSGDDHINEDQTEEVLWKQDAKVWLDSSSSGKEEVVEVYEPWGAFRGRKFVD